MSTSEKVSINSKHIVLSGLAAVTGLTALYMLMPGEGVREVVLPIATGILGFLAGISDKLWGG
jgi:hypothetical protein